MIFFIIPTIEALILLLLTDIKGFRAGDSGDQTRILFKSIYKARDIRNKEKICSLLTLRGSEVETQVTILEYGSSLSTKPMKAEL